MNCVYTWRGELISEEDLMKKLEDAIVNSNTSIADIIYSRATKLTNRTLLLESLKVLGKLESSKTRYIFDGDVSYEGESGAMSISSFLDSPFAVVNGRALYTLKDLDDYIDTEKQRLVTREGLSEAEATAKINNEISRWEMLSEDGKLIHRLCTDFSIGVHQDDWEAKSKEFITSALTIMPSDSLFKNRELLRSLYMQFATFYRNNKSKSVESTVVRNIGLTAKLKELDKELFGHIDYAFIDLQGRLHLYNFKVTGLHPAKWVKAKRDKYKLEGAFIKQMLIANGIYVDNISEITYDIVPLELIYNDDFTEIKKIQLHDPIPQDYVDGKYLSRDEDNDARWFIEVPFGIENLSREDIDISKEIFELTFPFMSVGPERIGLSAKEWIKNAPSVGDTESLIIKEVNEPDCRYRVILYGKTYDIEESTSKENNKEIQKLVTKHLTKLNSELGSYSDEVANAIERVLTHKLRFIPNDIHTSPFLNRVLSKYFPPDKDTEPEWKLNKELLGYNILLFENIKTNQLDVVILSSEDLELMGIFRRGATNLLGSYRLDGNQEALTLKGDMGNIELIRGLLLLNLLEPQLKGTKLGKISVISSNQNGLRRSYYIDSFVKNYFSPLLKVVKLENRQKLLDVVNNLSKASYINPSEDIIRTYDSIIENLSQSLRDTLEDIVGFGRLRTADDKNLVQTIFDLMENLNNMYFRNLSPELIYELAHPRESNYDNLVRSRALLYELLAKAYSYYVNETPEYEHDLAKFDSLSFTAPTVPDYNVRIVVNNMQTMIDSIAYEQNQQYENNISKTVLEYYKACGYSDILNLTIGNQLHLFDNLYQTDEYGNRLLIFKNPYDEGNDLKPHERLFLKKTLYYINVLKCQRIPNMENKFTGYEDPAINEYINNEKEGEKYLWVPLMRASKTSQRQQNLSDRIGNLKRGLRILFKSEDWFTEVVSKMTPEEREKSLEGVKSLHLNNPFDLGEHDEKDRLNYINKQGIQFFETNVENILTEYMAKAVEVDKLNKFLLSTKGLLLLLYIMGSDSDYARKAVEKEMTYIKEYITRNTFNLPTMEPKNQKIIAAVSKLKQHVTFLNLAGNLVSFFRDIINGFGENYLRTLTKFQTDIKAKYLTEAYAYVITHGRSNAMNINLLSKLNIRYRLSNADLAKIKERLITGRNGVYNWDNWAYSTLRSPDFLNRMVLFVARCMQDGVWDAYSLQDGKLVYDVKKDTRFLHFINDDYDDPNYLKEKALFILHVKNWNKEHPGLFIDWAKKELPEPYSDQEILAIKNVANNIYGSYDRSLKADYETTALGTIFTMYTTWMNGMWNNWFLKPDKYNIHHMTTLQQSDENGNPIYMDDNGTLIYALIQEDGSIKYINETTEEEVSVDNLIPVLEEVPVIVLGIWYSLKDIFYEFRENGIRHAWKYMMSNEVDKRNMAQGLSLILIALLFAWLFKIALTPAYNDSKKKSSHLSTGERLITSLAYRSLNGARDSFAGPLNIFEYFGEQLDPPIYRVPIKLIKDTGNTIFGDKTFVSLVTGNIALARTFKDIAL